MAESKEFKKLRSEWYKKLKDEGFNDIETMNGELKEYSTTLVGNIKKASSQHGGWQFKAEYHRLASKFLNEYRFSAELDKVIWEYHTNGISARNITKALSKIGIKTNRTSVWLIVKRLRIKMFDMYLAKTKPQYE